MLLLIYMYGIIMMTERDYDKLAFSASSSVLLVILLIIVLLVGPDYLRAQEYTEFDKCLVLEQTRDYFLGQPTTYNYKVRTYFEDGAVDLYVHHSTKCYAVGTYTTVYYTPDRLRYRFKNGLY